MGKLNEKVNWYIDGGIKNVREKVTGVIQIMAEEFLGRSRTRLGDKIHRDGIRKYKR